MRDASLIQQRLTELAAKANEIRSAQYSGAPMRSGRTMKYVPHPLTAGWGTSVLSLFRQSFGESSIHTQNFHSSLTNFSGYLSSFETLHAIFLAAKEDSEGGYIFSLQGLVKAEVLSDALEQAEELLKSGYKDPACVLVGVSLEIAVKHLAGANNVPHTKLDRMNTDLGKAGAYNMAKQKQITACADIRNKAAHGDWSAYSEQDVRDMHAGVQRFIANFL